MVLHDDVDGGLVAVASSLTSYLTRVSSFRGSCQRQIASIHLSSNQEEGAWSKKEDWSVHNSFEISIKSSFLATFNTKSIFLWFGH